MAQNNLFNNHIAEQSALQRLTTGLRINSGKDDPSGLIAASVLGSEVVSIGQAITNSTRANNIVATADSALSQVSTLLNNIRGLVQASANKGAISASEIAANQVQVDSAIDSIDRIGKTTVFGGDPLLNGSKAFNVAGNLGSVFQTTADIQVQSFDQSLHTGAPNGDVKLQIDQQATQATVRLQGLSQSSGAGLNNLSRGTSTHASTTFQGFGAVGANAAGAANGSNINGLTVTTGAGATATIDVSSIVPAEIAGATTTFSMTNTDSALFGTSNPTTTLTLQNGASGLNITGTGATYLAAQINAASKTTGISATVAGTVVTLTALEKDGTAKITLASSAASLAAGGAAVTTSNVANGTAVGTGVDLTTIQLAGSRNQSSPVDITVDNALAVKGSQALVDAINARAHPTG